ncbi:MAG TPA: methyltransferase domain-containing protein [Planctomycetes bacterium]|nr:methyltransferase domain-containing protein [Planctomycetota bacterium]
MRADSGGNLLTDACSPGSAIGTRTVVVQASSRSWQGGADLCLNPVEGTPAVRVTVERFLAADPSIRVVLAAPATDRGGDFDDIFADLPVDRFEVVYAADASPLERLLVATCDMGPEDVFLRVDGLHFAVLVDRALEMLAEAAERGLDVLKFPDDYPVQLGADVYRVGALRSLQGAALAPGFEVHPKYELFRNPDTFRCEWIEPPAVTEEELRRARSSARELYHVRAEATGAGIGAGDQLAFHYELAVDHLPRNGRVLDIACGNGFGTRLLAERGFDVLGGDLDPGVIEMAENGLGANSRAEYAVLDATALDLEGERFDAVVTMETIEHVDARSMLREAFRVLRPGGVLVLSTPQNALGEVPINPEHLREYSLEEIEELVGEHFEVREVIGIKQGRIVLPGSPRGTNTVIVAVKPS